MSGNIVLVGYEEVARAGHNMQHAAESIQRSAAEMQQAAEAIQSGLMLLVQVMGDLPAKCPQSVQKSSLTVDEVIVLISGIADMRDEFGMVHIRDLKAKVASVISIIQPAEVINEK